MWPTIRNSLLITKISYALTKYEVESKLAKEETLLAASMLRSHDQSASPSDGLYVHIGAYVDKHVRRRHHRPLLFRLQLVPRLSVLTSGVRPDQRWKKRACHCWPHNKLQSSEPRRLHQ